MKGMIEPRPAKVQTEFTDALLTGRGGWSVPGRLAERLGLLKLLSGCVRVKERARGASDGEMLWSPVASLAAGNGALSRNAEKPPGFEPDRGPTPPACLGLKLMRAQAVEMTQYRTLIRKSRAYGMGDYPNLPVM